MAKLSLTILDAFGRTTSKVVEFTDQIDLATYGTWTANYVAALDAIIDGQVVRADLILEGITAGTAAPVANANVDVAALFQGYVDQSLGKKATLRIPTFDPDLVSPDGTIDLTNASVDAFLDWYSDVNGATISDGEDVEAWISGRLER